MGHAGNGTTATFSERIADYICGEDLSNVDAASAQRAKQRLAYHVGLAFSGLKAREPEIERAITVARDLSEGGGESSLIGLPYRTTVDAVFDAVWPIRLRCDSREDPRRQLLSATR